MGTNGSNRTMLINTRERAVSTDINRLQAFLSQDLGQLFMYWLLAKTTEDAGGTGVIGGDAASVLPTGPSSPPTSVIFSGLLVGVVGAASDCTVSPGIMYMADPDSPVGADDSLNKFVNDAGIPVANGTFPFSSNAGPGVRIDVIECSRNIVVTETSSRDIYNTSTGLFAPSTVNKVQQTQLTYRIRRGTQGAGFPGTASGWVPLCVICVPTGATNYDGCTFWDVRPLLSDFVTPTFMASRGMPARMHQILGGTTSGATGNGFIMQGKVEGSFSYFRAGGAIYSDVFAAAGLDAYSNDVGEPNLASSNLVTPGLWYFYALFPFGLPRWMRYKNAPGAGNARNPGGFRGVPCFSATIPIDATGAPKTAVQPPTNSFISGTGTSTTLGVLLASGHCDYTTSPPTAKITTSDGDWHYAATPVQNVVSATGVTTAGGTFTLKGGDVVGTTNFPTTAKAIRVLFSLNFTTPAGVSDTRLVSTFTVGAYSFSSETTFIHDGTGSTAMVYLFTVDLPVPPTFPASLGVITETITGAWNLAGFSAVSATAKVIGWKM